MLDLAIPHPTTGGDETLFVGHRTQRFVISYTVVGCIWKGVVISATVHSFMILCSHWYREDMGIIDFLEGIILRQHRTNWCARLAWICFRHVAQKFFDLRQQACKIFVQPDEKSYCAIRTPKLCGIALRQCAQLLCANCAVRNKLSKIQK